MKVAMRAESSVLLPGIQPSADGRSGYAVPALKTSQLAGVTFGYCSAFALKKASILEATAGTAPMEGSHLSPPVVRRYANTLKAASGFLVPFQTRKVSASTRP